MSRKYANPADLFKIIAKSNLDFMMINNKRFFIALSLFSINYIYSILFILCSCYIVADILRILVHFIETQEIYKFFLNLKIICTIPEREYNIS